MNITDQHLAMVVNTVQEMMDDRGTPCYEKMGTMKPSDIQSELLQSSVRAKGDWCGMRIRDDTYLAILLRKFQIRIPRSILSATDCTRLIMVTPNKPSGTVMHTVDRTLQAAAESAAATAAPTKPDADDDDSETADAAAAGAGTGGRRVEVFWIKELLFNISHHAYVPRHEVVPEDEVARVLEALGITTRTLLPIIRHTDPMARYMGVQANQVMRITRSSPMCGPSTVYRCVV